MLAIKESSNYQERDSPAAHGARRAMSQCTIGSAPNFNSSEVSVLANVRPARPW
jgi:hypothetical protein